MIALDTNAIVRVLTEDDEIQAKAVQAVIKNAETNGRRLLILSEVVIETVWVLESVYQCSREEIAVFIESLLGHQLFTFQTQRSFENQPINTETKAILQIC